jgi:hypothetical protein
MHPDAIPNQSGGRLEDGASLPTTAIPGGCDLSRYELHPKAPKGLMPVAKTASIPVRVDIHFRIHRYLAWTCILNSVGVIACAAAIIIMSMR